MDEAAEVIVSLDRLDLGCCAAGEWWPRTRYGSKGRSDAALPFAENPHRPLATYNIT
jgi:hypothetical protein